MRIAYFVHDVHDPAVARRVAQLREGGGEVRLFGFRRQDEALADVAGAPVLDLGRTYDGGFARRSMAIMRKTLLPRASLRELAGANVIIARSFELLFLASILRKRLTRSVPLVYECVDIHRFMLSARPAGILLQAIERRLIKRISLLVITSPAFRDAYFAGRQGYNGPALLLENKTRPLTRAAPAHASSPPWRIGWYGNLRCRKSLSLLSTLTTSLGGRLQVVLAGRPALTEVPDFYEQVNANPHLNFHGPYDPEDLERLYQLVQFSWCIDYFEAGGNSEWLLPNRLYEGCAYGAVPIGLERVETGRWMKRQGVGVRLGADEESDLSNFFSRLTAGQFETLKQDVDALPAAVVVQNKRDASDLISELRSLEPA